LFGFQALTTFDAVPVPMVSVFCSNGIPNEEGRPASLCLHGSHVSDGRVWSLRIGDCALCCVSRDVVAALSVRPNCRLGLGADQPFSVGRFQR